MTVFYRDSLLTAFNQALQDIHSGIIIADTIFKKSEHDLLLYLADSNIIAYLDIDYISDDSLQKR